ncbi:MAG TPA: DUF1841 family protein [Steroidobacteraceae bacterium]|nr:DUF1841 family protein [Steroidobacteraceae bacterium]
MSLFADQGRAQLRARYRHAWQRWRAGEPLSPLDAQIAAVIGEHPEYQSAVVGDEAPEREYPAAAVGDNPFLHLGLHLAVREQISTDRPAGVAQIHRRLTASLGSSHAAEHRMIEPLAETLWEAQRAGRAADEQAYLQRLQRL